MDYREEPDPGNRAADEWKKIADAMTAERNALRAHLKRALDLLDHIFGHEGDAFWSAFGCPDFTAARAALTPPTDGGAKETK